ncbi:MAG: transposase [Gammaproteobacteria bacterium]|nr:transposase [Gammaproteobacteria bacterium]
MSRPLRLAFAGALYHITSRGDRRGVIYRTEGDRARFNALLEEVVERYAWHIHAWCQMTNHYHLLVETPFGDLPQGMRQLNGGYANAFNRKHQLVGHVFQGRYKAILVQREAHLLELARYIVLNPVRAGLVAGVEQWRWSSFRQTAGVDKPDSWLTVDAILSQFARTRREARRRYEAFVAAGRNAGSPWISLRNGVFLGDEQFVSRHLDDQGIDERVIEVPAQQTRRAQRSLVDWEQDSRSRDEAIVGAYRSGAYTLREIGEYFGLHYSRVSRIVSVARGTGAKGKT